jgi:hypothetical protein
MAIQNDEVDDGLTEEERAALTDENDEGGDTNEDDQGDDGEGGNGGDADAADDGDDADDAAAAGRDDGEAAGDGAEQQEAQAQQGAPLLVAQAPADADEKLAEIATKKDELIAKFDDGDITAKEYQQQLDGLGKQEREIERAVDKAAIAFDMEQQRLKNEWTSTTTSFLDANKVYRDNPRLYRALDQEVRDVAVTDEGKAMTGAQILAKAHANLSEAFGLKTEAPKEGAKPGRKVVLPPTLGKVPAAEGSDTDGGKYAGLDRLATTDPLAYEEKLMSLSESERDAYLSA